MKWNDVIKKCWKNFEKAVEEGEFDNLHDDASYIDESNRIYHLLSVADYYDSRDIAIYDVVSDIFYELVKGKHQREKSSKSQTKVC